MQHADRPSPTSDDRFVAIWNEHHDRLVARANRMLRDEGAAEDIVQEAFRRLSSAQLEEIDDAGGWLAVVARRLCLNQLRVAYVRHEAVGADATIVANADPLDRVTLDDEVQAALAIVLDALSPAERTAFVLHDVFGFPFDAVATIVGRTPGAVRQLASRARRSVRRGPPSDTLLVAVSPHHDLVVERFIAACEGGDIGELLAVLDPDIDGHAELIGGGTLVDATGRSRIGQRLIGLFGPGSDTVLVPVSVEGAPAVVAYTHGHVAGVIRLEHADGMIRHVRAFVLPPASRPAG